ncbi:S8 family serine peptidase [Winogradskyella sp.]|uniref:S8 family peptidase n=1 Tax=Winogradskyella sp. TaxID=1883156 RepID=UPI0026332AC6|nr:S8 family serine peptidase [Winogradskyella sp.]
MKKDYKIKLSKKGLDKPDFSKIFKRPIQNIKDGREALISSNEIDKENDDDVRIYNSISTCYTKLDENEILLLKDYAEIEEITSVEELMLYSQDEISPIRESDFVSEIKWNVKQVKADMAWNKATGKGVKIAILDSGVDTSHPDLNITGGSSFVTGISDWQNPTDPHGTFCAGIIGAKNNANGVIGIAHDSEIYAYRISNNGRAKEEWVFAAMEEAIKEKIDVVSFSLWNTGGENDPNAPFWSSWEEMARKLVDAGCSVVGIAGNSGNQANHWVTNPSRCPSYISVGATKENESIWEKSSYGPINLPVTQSVEIVAPGHLVLSTNPGGGYGIGSGTSYAAPHVAAAIALLKQAFPHWTPQEIRQRLHSSSKDIYLPGRDEKSGFGLLDCNNALSFPI